jgi:glycine oxidase
LATNQTTSVTVIGCGIFGLWQALALARDGHRVRLIEASQQPFVDGASRWAGAMLAPDCEAESAPPIVRDLGRSSLALWREVYPDLAENGTLVVAAARDGADLKRFASVTQRFETLDGEALSALEPALAGRFSTALHYPAEAHMDGVRALNRLLEVALARNVDAQFGRRWDGTVRNVTIDCRGYAARADVPGLRGVRGERLMIESDDVMLNRPVRLLHPRQPIYVVPQGDKRFVIGATVIERDDASPMTVRSGLELLGSAYALHPGFAEARILDMGAGVRPAFADNVPRIIVENDGELIRVNGAYRHGFLLAPVLARAVADYLKTGASMALIADAAA